MGNELSNVRSSSKKKKKGASSSAHQPPTASSSVEFGTSTAKANGNGGPSDQQAPASGGGAESTSKKASKKGVNFADDPADGKEGAASSDQQQDHHQQPARPPPQVGPSLVNFEHTSTSQRGATSPRGMKNGVMITDALEDVRVKYHINPKEIGHGHYGIVRKCMNRETREWYAIKSIRKSKVGKIEVLKREVEILREVRHPHIVMLVDIYEDTKYLHLITELCTGGELFDRIIAKTQSDEGHFSEHDAAVLVRSILDAIAYCHDEKQIVHRDLKPENFLFKTEAEDAPIKIIDFGLSRHDTANRGVMKTKVGTPYYVAPEVLNREYTKSCDMWSIGVITYILLCGYPPFYGDSDNQIFEHVRTGRFDFPSPDWDGISAAAKNFICSLLRKDPNARLSAAAALSHPWILEQVGPSVDGQRMRRSSVKISHDATRSVTFRKFVGMQKLKKAALGYIATHLNPSEVGELETIFQKIDADHDGVMTLQEIDGALAEKSFPADLQSELRKLREDLCLSGEDTVNWRDFSAAMMDKKYATMEDKIREAFEHFKRSGDEQCLLVSDLVEIFGGEAEVKEIIGDLDDDGDGKITYEEFKSMMAGSFADDMEE
mmetsp:Transcript_30293/g.65546  ORF Transcript_30293/g.65546 Transcript_30293/m.65546 type:complete len:605 (+) Transcript_30293:671-2485(+)